MQVAFGCQDAQTLVKHDLMVPLLADPLCLLLQLLIVFAKFFRHRNFNKLELVSLLAYAACVVLQSGFILT